MEACSGSPSCEGVKVDIRTNLKKAVARIPVRRLIIPVLLLMILLIGVELSLAVMFNKEEARRDAELHITRNQVLLDVVAFHVETIFSSITADLLVMSDLFEELLGSEEVDNPEKMLENIGRSLSGSKMVYDQIRYLDAQGIERVRVDYRDGSPYVVPGPELQDKSDRYYFTDSIHLEKGQLYISPLDLNIEKGEIELPYKPMIRFATPIIDSDGNSNGVVVINYLVQDMFDNVTDLFSDESNSGIEILNSDGYYLVHPQEPEREFAFMFAGQKDDSIIQEDGELWAELMEPEGVFISDGMLFIFRHVDIVEEPRLADTRSSSEQAEGYPLIFMIRQPLSSFVLPLIPDPGLQLALFGIVFLLDLMIASVVVFQWDRRKRDLDAIQTRNETLELVQRSAHIGFYSLDVKTDTLIWSDEVYEIFKVTPGSFSGTYEGFLGYVHPDDRERISQAFQEALQERTGYQIQHRVICPDGSIVYVNEVVILEYDDNGNPVKAFGTTHDISDIAAFEDELLHQNTLLNEAQRIAHLGFWEASGESDDLIWSDEVYRIFGEPVQSFTPTFSSFLDYVHPDDRDSLTQTYYDSIENQKAYSIRHRILRKDGTLRWVEERGSHTFGDDGNFLRTLGTVYDITESVAREQALNTMKEQLESMIRKVPDIVYRCEDDEERNVLYINDAVRQITGFASEIFLRDEGRGLNSIIHPDDLDSVRAEIRSAIDNNRVYQVDYRIIDSSGGVLNVQEFGQRSVDVWGNVILEGSITDVSLRSDTYGRMRKFLDLQGHMVLISDGYRLQHANRRFLEFLAYDSFESFLEDHTRVCELFIADDAVFHPGKIEKDEANWIEALKKVEEHRRIVMMLDGSGKRHIFTVNVARHEQDAYLLTFADISESYFQRIRYEEQALHDSLTGLYNRHYFSMHSDEIVEDYRARGLKVGLGIFDIDSFKYTNDTFGHEVGDVVLVSLARILTEVIDGKGYAVRWGGDEFVLLLETDGQEAFCDFTEKIRGLIDEAVFPVIDHQTCSFGLTLHDATRSMKESLHRADQALYRSKTQGRNRISFLP